MNLMDLTGKEFGRWKVIKYSGNKKWLCECSCENKTVREVDGNSLKRGLSKSCGCLHYDSVTVHGESRTRLYLIWKGMKDRSMQAAKYLY